jgi:hypothetical protein
VPGTFVARRTWAHLIRAGRGRVRIFVTTATSIETERFRRQHEELVALAGELLRALDPVVIAVDPSDVRRRLARFAGKLGVHAAMEERALYPRLLQDTDPAVRAKARSLLDDVGGLYDAFFAYTKRWSDPETLRARPSEFVAETYRILKILGRRMMQEDAELYPLVDARAAAA